MHYSSCVLILSLCLSPTHTYNAVHVYAQVGEGENKSKIDTKPKTGKTGQYEREKARRVCERDGERKRHGQRPRDPVLV